MHDAAPSLDAYLPSSHETQVSLFEPGDLPAEHALHELELVDPKEEVMLPLGQELQRVIPVVSL